MIRVKDREDWLPTPEEEPKKTGIVPGPLWLENISLIRADQKLLINPNSAKLKDCILRKAILQSTLWDIGHPTPHIRSFGPQNFSLKPCAY